VPWRLQDRMKTVSVALLMCLNIGVDPPDLRPVGPRATLECWIDPLSQPLQKALETIGKQLEAQYQRWQPRARCVPGWPCSVLFLLFFLSLLHMFCGRAKLSLIARDIISVLFSPVLCNKKMVDYRVSVQLSIHLHTDAPVFFFFFSFFQ
jgi:hypothetical protein